MKQNNFKEINKRKKFSKESKFFFSFFQSLTSDDEYFLNFKI